MTEEVVGQLIGAAGIDLTLIGPLSSLAETSTDRLTLESLAGDVAALDWQSPEAIMQGLASVNFHAQRAAHPHDGEAPKKQSGIRQVYAFDMSRFRGPGELIKALTDLNGRRQVRTFSIGLGDSLGVGITREPARPAAEPPLVPIEPVPPTQGTTPPGEIKTTPVHDVKAGEPPASGLDLDDLIDQLDQADP